MVLYKQQNKEVEEEEETEGLRKRICNGDNITNRRRDIRKWSDKSTVCGCAREGVRERERRRREERRGKRGRR